MTTDRPPDRLLPSPQWPQSYGSVYRDCIPNALMSDILNDAPAVANCPNFWTPKANVEAAGQACTACEAAISILYEKVMRHWLPHDWAGAEWWVQVYERGKGLAFHFDKDEHLFKEDRRMVHPMLSSILYLTGSTFPKRLGPTVVVDQRFDNAKMRACPDDPQRCAMIYPRRGAFAVFDGGLGHGVLGSAAPDLRATLLINWWPHQPQGVNAITPKEASEHSLSIKRWPCSTSSTASSGAIPATAGNLPLQQLSLGGSQLPTAEPASQAAQAGAQSAVPGRPDGSSSSSAAGSSAGEQGSERGVDGLLYSKGLSLVGSSAVSSVAIDHSGWALYPLGDEAQEEQEEGEAPMQTAAVFVPLHMMPSPSSSSASGSDREEEGA
ncbi:hypothetical protein COCSUDRAFT_64407 [Coccomyxa subellipsoidea C-169]|uniref:Uncharacterized protein n=1 Tax=Coccomyxa subellipsoidea (strain C-169) TaxID=574566 RepID=I0Z6I6_COCSC|nr:hypothetical protein COCSUDRAFT_64407 [Coccomyxa subellipsoidea C-169]EIE26255.1 hypothetical protein COCSUDRAFT_64407 [Coccomyxa subellipsoidea C-169]|eukprot:XP_005650799.1 hypothetical protein COCSUDRAFT_64407 [Coccomyxa subellipsoidea C-169]